MLVCPWPVLQTQIPVEYDQAQEEARGYGRHCVHAPGHESLRGSCHHHQETLACHALQVGGAHQQGESEGELHSADGA